MTTKSLGTIERAYTRREGDYLIIEDDENRRVKIRISRFLIRSIAVDFWEWLKIDRAELDSTERTLTQKATP